MELTGLLKDLLDEIQKISRSESVVGKPREMGDAHVVPLCRVSVGFGAGTTDLSGSGGKRDGSLESGAAGGGLTVEPRAFVVVGKDGVPQLLSMRKGSASIQHAVELPVGPAKPSDPKR